ncbi:MAG: hypothetical protein JST52_01455 [Bacteroidetes bacterium]|nr:hypothetical protein [Bacteroidota bacterium]MBS1739129.1 hypothetical protein [Bacteroidota bacterium]MBS1740598.1 hypothetical protein [Bacteroidota bacterium]MBS1777176.1 hypothetical protein [Bacteroidota bacterium]
MNLKEINIGIGLGDLKLDSPRETVEVLLGKPFEKEKYNLSELDDDATEAWHYDEQDLSLSFDEENNWLLTSIAVSSDQYTLDGVALVGKSKKDALLFIDKKGWKDVEEDEEIANEEPGNSLLHINDANMSFWFVEDVLTEIQFGALLS